MPVARGWVVALALGAALSGVAGGGVAWAEEPAAESPAAPAEAPVPADPPAPVDPPAPAEAPAPAPGEPAAAAAVEPLPGGGLFAALPSPPVAAGSPVRVVFLALGADGRPREGLQAEVSASAGAAAGWEALAPGVYATTWTGEGASGGEVSLTARGLGPEAEGPREATATLRVRPAPPALQAKASPAALTLGEGEPGATLTLIGADARSLLARASAGTLGAPREEPGGAVTLSWTPPEAKDPRLALLAFADALDPSRSAAVALPLSGPVELPIPGRPGESVALEVEGRRFGPAAVGEDGKATIPAVVPPGVTTGVALLTRDGAEVREPLDLGIPEAPRLAWGPLPPTLPAGATVPVRVLAARPDGSPDPEATLELSASAGSVGPVRSLGEGRFEADLTLPADPGSVTLRATLGTELQSDTLELAVAAPLAAGGARPGVSASPVARVVLAPERAAAAPGSPSPVRLRLAAVDAWGLPCPGAEVSLSVDQGGGALSAGRVVTGADGTAELTYTPGAEVGLASISAVSGAGAGAASLLQVPDPAALDGRVLPSSGPAEAVAADATWRALLEAGASEGVLGGARRGPRPPPVSATHGPPKEEPPRWFRLRASAVGGAYRFEQAPSEDPGPLLPSRLAVGGEAGPAAVPVGGELDARVWGDPVAVPWFGVHGQLRSAAYAIDSAAFEGTANDVLVGLQLDALVRYPFSVGPDQFWVGAKGGLHANDFLYFAGCLEPECGVAFEPLLVTGLGVGAELGAEFGRLFLVGGTTLGLAGATQPYSNAVDLELGYAVVGDLFLDLGFTSLSRSVILRGAESGLDRATLTDSNMIVKIGLGISL